MDLNTTKQRNVFTRFNLPNGCKKALYTMINFFIGSPSFVQWIRFYMYSAEIKYRSAKGCENRSYFSAFHFYRRSLLGFSAQKSFVADSKEVIPCRNWNCKNQFINLTVYLQVTMNNLVFTFRPTKSIYFTVKFLRMSKLLIWFYDAAVSKLVLR